jgi:hypothetical protein
MKKSLLFLFALAGFVTGYAQNGSTSPVQGSEWNPTDSTSKLPCGADAEKVYEAQHKYEMSLQGISTQQVQSQIQQALGGGTNPTVQFVAQNAFPAALVETCGAFNIYYEDYLFSPLAGFAEVSGGLGAQRRATFCAVLNYIQSTITIPPGVTIDIFVDRSLSASNTAPPGTGWLGVAGPYFVPGTFGTVPGFYGGNMFTHVTTGIDPDINNYDGHMQINFDAVNTPTFMPLTWWNDHTNITATCAFDLYTVILHEMSHVMGWLSSVREDLTTNHNPQCIVPNNGFTRYDDLFLYHTANVGTGPFNKVVQSSPIGINPVISTFPQPMRSSNIWLYNNGAPMNQPVYSGDFLGYYAVPPVPANINSTMSHLNDNYFSFTYRAQLSPGYQPGYVMAAAISKEMRKREWTLPELRAWNTMGYSFNYPFASSFVTTGFVTAAIMANTPAHKNNYNLMTEYAIWSTTTMAFPESTAPNFNIPVNLNTTTNPTLTQLTINLTADPTLVDNEANPITIIPTSLFNIRGCGSGGNNSNCLAIQPGNQSIIYTPRPGFRGRAQFGFYLTDGIERGAFKVYTIDVGAIDATYLATLTTVGSNLIMNPNFEEGTQVRLRNVAENIENTGQEFFREGSYFSGEIFADNHPYLYHNNFWSSAGGVYVQNSWKECNHINAGVKGNYGWCQSDFNTNAYTVGAFQVNPLANTATIPNDRYSNLFFGVNFSELLIPAQQCHRYRLEGDLNFQRTGLAVSSVYTFTLQFTSNPGLNPYGVTVNYSTPVPVTVTTVAANTWQHFSFDFNYCGSPSSFMNFVQNTLCCTNGVPLMDNLSLIEVPALTPYTASIANSNPSVCPGGCSTLTGSVTNPFCSPVFTWMPGSLTGTTVNVCPAGNTTYTLSVNDGCSTTTATTTVNVYPVTTVTATASPNPVCSGNTTVLTAAPAGLTGIVWNPGALSGNGVTTPPLTSTTTYSVNATDANGCPASGNVTVNVVAPATAVATASPNPVCTGSTTVLNLSPVTATGIVWNPGALTGNGVTTPPITSNTTYTVTATDVNGCAITTSVPVNTVTCACVSCTPLPTTITTNPLPFQTYCITSNTTISGNISFTASEFKIAPGVNIIVSPTSTLTISGCHLYACTDMWQGITVQNGGKLNIVPFTFFGSTRYPLIEDAYVAVSIPGTSLLAGVLNVNGATFNRNQVGIYIIGYTLNNPTYPFSIQNSVFTCRDLPYTPNSLSWPSTIAVKATAANAGLPLASPYISNAAYSQTSSAAFLRFPLTGQKPQAGIRLRSVGLTISAAATPYPTATPTYREIVIGAAGSGNNANYNVFDNLIIGIDAQNTNFTCYNNVFQNTITYGPGGGSGGIGINARAEQVNVRLQAIPIGINNSYINKFFDCSRSINSTNYFEHNITFCDVRSTQVNPAPVITLNPAGKYGFTLTTNRFRVMNVSSNKIYNIENGIVFNANYGPVTVGSFSSTNGQYSGQVLINKNLIRPHIVGNPITTQYVSNAIYVANVNPAGPMSVLASTLNAGGTTVDINNNDINLVYRGIYATTWQRKDMRVISNGYNSVGNPVTLVPDPFPGPPVQFGISCTNNIAFSTYGIKIYSNHVQGYGTTNNKLHAIYTSMNHNQYLNCNNTSNTYDGLVFDNPELPTATYLNTMSTQNFGFVLNNNGVIGIQGSFSNPADNKWSGTWSSSNVVQPNKTATLNTSSASSSPMWVRGSSALYNPNNSGFTTSAFGTDNYWYNGTNALPGTLWYGATPLQLGCPQLMQTNGHGGSPAAALVITPLEQIALDQIPFAQNTAATRFIAKSQLYRAILSDHTLLNNSQVLQNFMQQSQGTSRELFVVIEDAIAAGDANTAFGKASGIVPHNQIELNYQEYYFIYLRFLNDTIMDDKDSLSLRRIADGCPFTDGPVVYQARALFNAAFNTAINFEDQCDVKKDSRLAMEFEEEDKVVFDAVIFPNPANDQLFITPFTIVQGSIHISVRDLNGKLVTETDLPVAEGIANFNSSELKNGVYLVHISNLLNGEKTIKKLVIQK